jgi:hypothetical protein
MSSEWLKVMLDEIARTAGWRAGGESLRSAGARARGIG